ncbi:glycosyltransferase family 28 domain-containing protein [Colletotrichum tamarilloi]|uniref:Glycosyltransferase family 28 domain-containing protein n=1 Tax=Colletotrichum tamarilloi TaxID=1209934 RepID=A0ABQ9RPG4_9PEZI|nr:glycosyltransferase family 28 domain-containing protein [Colletotrichum tamarilloi]KAK1509654.1 glycosyltransferase family 28 domain-containing protein [Colletotrichum tamarilloi]
MAHPTAAAQLALGTATESEATATPPPEQLHIDEIDRDGRHIGVVRDENRNIVYPSFVPPEVDSPNARSPQSTTAPTVPEIPPKDVRATKTESAPNGPDHLEVPGTSNTQERPPIDKKWRTEAPARKAGQSSATRRNVPKRSGTSYLDRALWEADRGGSSSSSSSSDSSDDENAQDSKTPAERKKAQDKANARRQKEIAERYRRFHVGNDNYNTKGKVKKDGRLRISVKETANTGYLAKALGQAVKKVVPVPEGEDQGENAQRPSVSRLSSATTATADREPKPRLNIVIMVIGSRGDAQPFLKIGKILKEDYGHRVRIATHPAFREFVEKDSGLEFFSVGGDPSELMAFMVKNPGMIPTLDAVKAGDIGRRRSAMAEMFDGFWRACINATDDEKDVHNLKMMGEKDPFIADAIIANPPSFAHIHCAEALGIPLHLMFTFPYTPTQAFPHPLASIKKSNVDPGYTNFISYPLVEMMVWQGLGDLVNDFRVKTLGLDAVSTLWAPGATYRLHVPFTYLWSPGLVPKPQDWGEEIDVSGFVFLDLASTFEPPSELEKFLDAGEPPIYIGFGSIVVDDADRFTQMIFEAVELAGVRALVSKGWGGLGGDEMDVPDNIFMLENTPHDWLFPRVKACVIHGGAGTTAIALKCGLPTMIVPFFGDQHFWGSILATSKAGPEAVPYKQLDAEKLAEGIKYCLTDEAKEAAAKVAKDIELEGDGAKNAVRSFHHHLTLGGMNSMRCSILRDRPAVWTLKNTNVKLSALAADIIVEEGQLSWKRLRLLRHTEWNDFEGPGEPVTGIAGSLAGTMGNVFGGIGSVPYRIAKTSHKRKEKKDKKKKLRALRDKRTSAKERKAATNSNGALQPQEGDEDNSKKEGDKAKAKGGDDSKAQKKDEGKAEDNKADKEDGKNKSQGEQSHANGNASSARPGAQERRDTMSSIDTGTTVDDAVGDYANEVGEGVGKSAQALARAPVDLSMAIAQGFHNAPRLYGDDTVRRPPRVTGISSGLKAAGKEFAYGIYDGTTGLVRLPVRGAKKEGVKGFVKGTGMGLTGFVLKDLSAIISPVGYTLKGIAKQVERKKQPDRVVRRARLVQGQRERRNLPGDSKKQTDKDVVTGWYTIRELLETLEAEKKQGIKGVFSHKKQRVNHAAFESVDIADRTLQAIKKGEDISTVVGTEKELRKADEKLKSPATRHSVDTRRSTETARARKSAEDQENSEGSDKNSSKRRNDIAENEEGEARAEAADRADAKDKAAAEDAQDRAKASETKSKDGAQVNGTAGVEHKTQSEEDGHRRPSVDRARSAQV